ncbi:hypothetical protein [Arenimonas alkanexedens]
MARRSAPEAPRKSLTAAEALAKIELIDKTIAAMVATAPLTFAALGGPKALAALCQNTCVGPIPRLTVQAWEAAAREHAEAQWLASTPGRFLPI